MPVRGTILPLNVGDKCRSKPKPVVSSGVYWHWVPKSCCATPRHRSMPRWAVFLVEFEDDVFYIAVVDHLHSSHQRETTAPTAAAAAAAATSAATERSPIERMQHMVAGAAAGRSANTPTSNGTPPAGTSPRPPLAGIVDAEIWEGCAKLVHKTIFSGWKIEK